MKPASVAKLSTYAALCSADSGANASCVVMSHVHAAAAAAAAAVLLLSAAAANVPLLLLLLLPDGHSCGTKRVSSDAMTAPTKSRAAGSAMPRTSGKCRFSI